MNVLCQIGGIDRSKQGNGDINLYYNPAKGKIEYVCEIFLPSSFASASVLVYDDKIAMYGDVALLKRIEGRLCGEYIRGVKKIGKKVNKPILVEGHFENWGDHILFVELKCLDKGIDESKITYKGANIVEVRNVEEIYQNRGGVIEIGFEVKKEDMHKIVKAVKRAGVKGIILDSVTSHLSLLFLEEGIPVYRSSHSNCKAFPKYIPCKICEDGVMVYRGMGGEYGCDRCGEVKVYKHCGAGAGI